MAEIPVAATTQTVVNDERTTAMPLWAALVGLVAMIALVWMLFSLGAQGSNADRPVDSSHAGNTVVVMAFA